MNRTLKTVVLSLLIARGAIAAPPALTIYNQNFAVVRDTVPLDLKSGENQVKYAGATMHLEPDSVILRDPAGKHSLQIFEQNFRADPVSQELLLSVFEGKTIEFETPAAVDGKSDRKIIKGKIVRSGYVPHSSGMNRYGNRYAQAQMGFAYSPGTGQPIIEVDGRMQFSLPGQPLFPALGDDTILKPTLSWVVQSDKPGKFDAELSYITGGMSWNADYNVISPEKGNTLEMVGWVTMDNQSGKSFQNANIKLMAGDVNKIVNYNDMDVSGTYFGGANGAVAKEYAPSVSEKAFDEYHLYTLARPATLLDRETKQVEFIHAAGIQSTPVYVYDGAQINSRYRGYNPEGLRQESDYGTESNPKVWTTREFTNSESNHLGMPLPKGRVRFYRRDAGGQLEFTGENVIDHTPKDEKLKIFTGSAFDLVGERKRTDYKLNNKGRQLDESFEIKLRNHKTESVEIRVVEHLYRWNNWEITAKSAEFTKTDAQTMQFQIPLKAGEEQTLTYTAHYTW